MCHSKNLEFLVYYGGMLKKFLPFIPPRLRMQVRRVKPSLPYLQRLVKNLDHLFYKYQHYAREVRFFFQRIIRRDRGWDDSDMWCLYIHLAKVIYPRLLHFSQNNPFPDDYDIQEALPKMCEAFYMVGTYDNLDHRYDKEKVQEGLNLFHEYFFGLWC